MKGTVKHILVPILSGGEIFEFAPFLDIFGWNNVVGNGGVEITTASFGKMKLCWGGEFIGERDLKDIDVSKFDAIILGGGFGFRGYFENIPKIKNILQEFQRQDKIIVGICTGSIILGECGILKGIRATTYLLDNNRYFRQLDRFGAIKIRRPIVVDGNIITSSSPKTAIDLAFLLLSHFTSAKNCKVVKDNMGF